MSFNPLHSGSMKASLTPQGHEQSDARDHIQWGPELMKLKLYLCFILFVAG